MNPMIERLRAALSATADLLGRLSLGRFVLLCLLLLIAAGMAQGIFRSEHKAKPVIHITRQVAPPTTPSRPAEPPAVAVPPNAEGNQSATPTEPETASEKNDINIKIGGEGIVIRRNKVAEQTERELDAEIEKEVRREIERISPTLEHDHSVSLPGLAALLIVLMFIVRLVAQSKVKAEARARTAESAADSAALERQLAEARLQAMQAQVEPHFLFNTLAAVEHLIETDPPRAASMQRNLIGYLRAVLPNLRRTQSTLGRELEISRSYLDILKVRMESRLDYRIDCPEGLASAQMPPLMLQTLVENAIEHGLEPKTEGGRIDISAGIRDGLLVITVADTGVGFAPQSAALGSAAAKVGAGGTARGVGLASLRERLNALYGARGRLLIEANSPAGTRAVLEFPYAFANHDDSTTPRPDR
jgi:signal transduction histidine kinase